MNGIELFLVALAGAWALTGMLNWLALISWRRAAGAHWTERARLLYTVRLAHRRNILVLIVLVPLLLITFNHTLGNSLFFFSVVGVIAGATLGSFAMKRAVWPDLRWRDWLRELLIMTLMNGVLIPVIYIVAFVLMPDKFNATTLLLGVVPLLVVIAQIFGLQLLLLRALHLVSPAPERLRKLAQSAATTTGARLRAVWICAASIAQVNTLIITKQFLFTTPMLERLSDDELAGICAHEAAHLTARRGFVVRLLAIPFCFFPLIFIRPVVEEFGVGVAPLLFVPLCVLIISFSQRRRTQSHLSVPDGSGAKRPPVLSPCPPLLPQVPSNLSPHTEDASTQLTAPIGGPAAYARAMALMYEHNQMPAVMPLRAKLGDPDLYDLMTKAGITPDFPKPLPPKRFIWTTWLLAFLTAALYAVVIFYWIVELFRELTFSNNIHYVK